MQRVALSCAMILIAGPVHGQGGKSKGAPSPEAQAAAIHAVRDYVLGYTKGLPNYTCTLTTRHASNRIAAGNINAVAELTKVEEQLNFVDGKEIRKIMRIDGRPATEDDAKQLRESTKGEFGSLLDAIFEPATGADLRWDRAATLNKTKVDVISVHVPQSKGYVLNGSRGSVRVPFEGFVFADAQTHAVMRLQLKCTMIPATFEMQLFDLTLDYRAAQVAGHAVILPSHFELRYRDFADDRNHTDDGQYAAYHQFSADSQIEFDGDKR